ncbi:hypothetical protein C2G38_2203552 [Gigaspora rosea]|uniref:BTB domain-containing protein n=1 Tax=Gigaspora rosea TaxID=44941 RepID=A0A397UMA1_9GLOM|nr:hypothetical protein C2G38_2203552 [Gigaspora rosea]
MRHYLYQNSLDKLEIKMTAKFFEKLSSNYLELLEDKEDFNVIIKIGEAPNAKVFQAHSPILKHRSLYFHNKLKIADKN